MCATYHWKFLDEGYYFASNHLNRRSEKKNGLPKSWKSQFQEFLDSQLWGPGIK